MDEIQLEEIQALRAIYGEDFHVLNETGKEFMIEIKSDSTWGTSYTQSIKFEFIYPSDYPHTSPPVFKLSCDVLSSEEITQLATELSEMFKNASGEIIMFEWIEFLRGHLIEKVEDVNKMLTNDQPHPQPDTFSDFDITDEPTVPEDAVHLCPVIYHGEPLTDRKSTFQAHVAEVTSVDQAALVVQELKTNRKIATATHNILAYRIYDVTRGAHVQDCDDDGESAAGSRLLHLLQIMDLDNVIVVVTRWYGGVHLGPDRFKHINNCARILLQQQGLEKKDVHRLKSKRKGKKK